MTRDYDLVDLLRAIVRFWWIALLIPVIILAALTVRNLTAEYQSSFRATILLPGDTEVPGSAERPELMILDDLGPVVESRAFAEIVAATASLPIEEIEGALSATRYSRVATIIASSGDRDNAQRLAEAAAAALPTAVNELMVAQGGQQATVKVIDPPGDPTRGEPDKWRITLIATVVGLAIGCFLAIVADASLRRPEPPGMTARPV
jgi:capsular polysaccharide biosynthesis protein